MVIDRKYTGLPEGVPLNPMQQLLVPHMEEHYNVIVAAPTASGKSQAVTMFGHKYLENKKRVCYIGIMRALAQEKADDWEEEGHPWKHRRKTVISGDYTMDAAKQIEIDNAEVICITPEALASRLRHPNSARNAWLHEIGLLVVDEVHLLSANDRGTNLEAALIEFTYEFPDVQIVALSATMPNVDDVGKWLTKLNGKRTEVVKSDYRPVTLTKHYYPFYETATDLSEGERIDMIIELLEDKPDQQFMVAVWKKTFGKKIEDELKRRGYAVAFHNANHDKVTRRAIEQSFKSGQLRVLISTSTLFTGVNLPARNVIITTVEAAMQDLPVYELQQAMGRAGRPRYDTEGDAYLFVPAQDAQHHIDRVERGEPIVSQMTIKQWLAMHFLGAMYLGRINDVKGFSAWFDRTLAQHQTKLSNADKRALLDGVLGDMRQRRMVMFDDYTKDFRLGHRGKIAAQMYMEPYHFSDILGNLRRYVSLTNPTDTDLAVAMGSCNGFGDLSINPGEKAAIPDAIHRAGVAKQYQKACAAVWYRVQGTNVPPALSNTNWRIFDDMPRLHAAVARAYAEVERWSEITAEELDILFTRVIMRCSAQNAQFGLRKFTAKERRALHGIGVYSFRDAQLNLSQVVKVIPFSRCIELGLARPGSEAPKVNEDGTVVMRDDNAKSGGFVGRRGFGNR